MIAFVWAQDHTGLIGEDGHLPWHLKDDLEFFHQVTKGQLVVMGRRTYEGLPKRPLPERTNIILTRDADYSAPGAVVLHSRADVLVYASTHPELNLMIVGGAQIFTLFKDDVDTLLVTRIAGTFTGDVRMPPLDWAQFELNSSRHVANADPALAHDFERWNRKH
ncbi:dihydrofolate reductase [Lacticaseibacillus yichunensis]|uniref:Dihydrofolate reductase n=1 Tax=Lacticaseibacillus yichunensis TaxID=2486015 RepID=A0ABW4CQC9_9LACO|nr:dihydrofolate reductase [Lacticaseibacillus yichunensis]